jgi:hypothetical protein
MVHPFRPSTTWSNVVKLRSWVATGRRSTSGGPSSGVRPCNHARLRLASKHSVNFVDCMDGRAYLASRGPPSSFVVLMEAFLGGLP